MPGRHRDHYKHGYNTRAKRVRDRAYADPATVCRRCGLTLAERRTTHPNDGWDAGHLNDGQVNGPLVPEHSSCNRSAGAQAMHRTRNGLNPSREW